MYSSAAVEGGFDASHSPNSHDICCAKFHPSLNIMYDNKVWPTFTDSSLPPWMSVCGWIDCVVLFLLDLYQAISPYSSSCTGSGYVLECMVPRKYIDKNIYQKIFTKIKKSNDVTVWDHEHLYDVILGTICIAFGIGIITLVILTLRAQNA